MPFVPTKRRSRLALPISLFVDHRAIKTCQGPFSLALGSSAAKQRLQKLSLELEGGASNGLRGWSPQLETLSTPQADSQNLQSSKPHRSKSSKFRASMRSERTSIRRPILAAMSLTRS